MGQAVTKSILDLQLVSMKPIGFGIIGPGAEEEQIAKRIELHAKQAVLAVSEMLSN
jgi:6,7-dimethyl-8-ribityllumazine synthase